MDAVLFVVTIPTKNKENRLKKGYSENLITYSTLDEETYLKLPVEKSCEDGKYCELAPPNISSSQEILSGEPSSVSETDQYTTPYGTFYCNVDSQANTYRIRRSSSKAHEQNGLSSSKSNINTEVQFSNDLNIPLDSFMETVMQEILKYFQIQNAFWSKSMDEGLYQITFTTEFNETYDGLMEKFNEWGFGDRKDSSVSALKCLASKTYSSKLDTRFSENTYLSNSTAKKHSGTWERFLNSVQSRLNVTKIIRDVRQDADITLDFIILLISAATVASFGLIESSTVFIASSTLISPLMGPIIAAIFGTVIKDSSLRIHGLINEFCGILIAVAIGFIFGLLLSASNRLNITDGLTEEITSMCELHSLIDGALIAVPTGAAAAIGVLGGNTGSLVGVAISASILPPAVNSGLLWALAATCKLFNFDFRRNAFVKTNFYSNDNATELAVMGCISMCLTISNVICIYIVGLTVLKIKEITPALSKSERQLWKNNIKLARSLNKNDSVKDLRMRKEFDALSHEDLMLLRKDCNMLQALNLYPSKTWTRIGSRDQPFEPSFLKTNTATNRWTKQYNLKKASYKIFSESNNQSPKPKQEDYSVPLSLSTNESKSEKQRSF